jgi:hypothetical protein
LRKENSNFRPSSKSEECSTVQFDLRTDVNRKRDGEISRIIGEMSLYGEANQDNDDDDLLSLMDKAS